MPLFVTVTPGTTVTSSTTLDASTLNLLGTPSVDVTGTVDGGSLSVTNGSLQLAAIANQPASTLVGNASGSSAAVTALTSTDLAFATGTVNIGTGAVTTAKLADSSSSATGVTYAKIQHVTDARLIGRSAGTNGIPQEISVGSNLTLASGTLNALRPQTAFTNVVTASSYTISNTRVSATEISALTTSITPQTSTSKVFVNFNISHSLSDYAGNNVWYRYAFILTRTIGGVETELGVPSGYLSNQVYGIKPVNYNLYYSQQNQTIQFLDTPGAATSATYKLKIYGNTSAPSGFSLFCINRTSDNIDSSDRTFATSQVILQEILP
jgi:hypothetical protein